jgi:hypothetical protein
VPNATPFALALDLRDRMYGEAPGPLEPGLVPRALEQREQGIAVPRRSVAQVRSLHERPGAPGQLAGGEREVLVEQMPE